MAGLLSARRVSATVGPQGPQGVPGPPGGPGLTGPAGSNGNLAHYVIPLAQCVTSTNQAAGLAKRCGGVSMTPAQWNQLKSTSVITLHVLLETTNAGNAASASLLLAGGGAPATLATVTTSGTAMTEVTADVSAYFRPGASAGVYTVVLSLNAFSVVDLATLSGAWLDITP